MHESSSQILLQVHCHCFLISPALTKLLWLIQLAARMGSASAPPIWCSGLDVYWSRNDQL